MSGHALIRHRRRGTILDRMAGGVTAALAHALDADDLARGGGLMQRLDPRVKLGGLIGLVVLAVATRSLLVLAGLLALAIVLAGASRIPLARLARQAWLGVLAVTGFIALPALFLVPGEALFRLPLAGWPVTIEGLRSATFLLGRAGTAATYGLLLVLTTPWPQLLKAMRAFHMPVVVVAILSMAHRYVFVLLELSHQLFEARRSRHIGRLPPPVARRLATGAAGLLLSRALDMSTEIHLAMIARGYRGEPKSLDDFVMRRRDWAATAGLAAIAALVIGARLGGHLP